MYCDTGVRCTRAGKVRCMKSQIHPWYKTNPLDTFPKARFTSSFNAQSEECCRSNKVVRSHTLSSLATEERTEKKLLSTGLLVNWTIGTQTQPKSYLLIPLLTHYHTHVYLKCSLFLPLYLLFVFSLNLTIDILWMVPSPYNVRVLERHFEWVKQFGQGFHGFCFTKNRFVVINALMWCWVSPVPVSCKALLQTLTFPRR